MIDTQIEHQGGWRLVMQNQLDWSNSIHQPVDVSFIRNYPHTVLAKAFLLAKWGQTQNARNYLDKFKSILGNPETPNNNCDGSGFGGRTYLCLRR